MEDSRVEARIISPWVGDGLTQETANRAQLVDDFPGSNNDVTGLPHGTPNLCMVRWKGEQKTLDEIELNPIYLVVSGGGIKSPHELPPVLETDARNSKLSQMGVDRKIVDSIVSKSREGAADKLWEYFRWMNDTVVYAKPAEL